MGRTAGLHATPIGRPLEEPCREERRRCRLRGTGVGGEIGPPLRHGHPASGGQLHNAPRLVPCPEEIPDSAHLTADTAVVFH